ncbi:DUF2889 domain-containing protein [Caulobacter soli]|uniref:DUF2889 domain-containing protein n=1 Tax=Caulobacter soli TaxID=2708539 RepID=UPI00196A9D6B|nr:DUF2889 domain-containing protein [Caulobacter soli]
MTQPAFHRHVLVTPGEGWVSAWVEDDYHHMGVTLRHDGQTIVGVEADMVRAPWSTCPGAVQQLSETFTGARLDEAAARGEKQMNCTHLHDMAVTAAAHARDAAPTRYEITVTDAVDGVRVAEITREGASALRLVERDKLVEEPAEAAGKTLFQLGEWIAALDEQGREAARLLRWAAIIAHGRAIPMERQSDATRMPANCFTFQPGRKEKARRVGAVMDFSTSVRRPLGERAAT